MKYSLDKQIENDIINAAKKYGVKKVVLFGSRARGDHSEKSDIDLAVSGGNAFDFHDELEEEARTLLMFDVVDLDSRPSEELLSEINRDGVMIYEEG